MKTFKVAFAVLASAMLGAMLLAPVRAQGLIGTFTHRTTVTINEPMEIPGQVLPPGTYVFRILDVVGSRNVMQVTNQEETKVFATIIAIPDYRLKYAEKPVIQYKEEAAGKPGAVRAWFFGQDNGGLEFVYPKERAVQLAEATHEYVPAETAEAPPENLKSVPLVAITPEGKEEPVAQAFEQTEVAQALPKTASPMPLIVLLGGAFFAVGFGLRCLAKQNS